MKHNRKIVFFIGAALFAATAVMVLLSFRSVGQIGEASDARKHTSAAIMAAENLFSELEEAETGQRGYALTGDKAYLESFFALREGISRHMDDLLRLTLIDEARRRLEVMAPLISAKMEEMSHVIELRETGDLDSVIAAVRDGRGKKLMDSIRSEKDGYIVIEESALSRHESEFQSTMRRLFLIIAATSLSALLFALAFSFFIYGDTDRKLRNLEHSETKRLLDLQEGMNVRLQQANETIRLSEEKLAVTLNSIGDAVMATDADGFITLLNPLAEQLTGWTQADAVGRPVEEIFHIINHETRQPFLIPVRETLADGTILGLANHTILVSRDGSERDIADSCAPIRNRAGHIAGVVLVFRDVTERIGIEIGLEKTRKELAIIKNTAEEASEFAESIINTVREPLISLNQDLRVVSASRSFYEVFRVKPEETVGQLIYDLGNKQWDIPKLRELLETILPQKATFDNYEVEHDFADIGRRIMLLNARQIKRVSGKERIILLAIEDITVRREIENGLEKAHGELTELTIELKRAARAKSEFLANMSHELRTPLNSINGFSEVLYDETFGALNDKQKKYVNNVLTSGKHLLLLINQILDMAKIEAGKMKLSISVLPMKSLLNEISLLVADMVSKKNLQMALEIAEDLPDIEADELKVKEIMYNLLSNAVKFTPGGGRIGMRAKRAGQDVEIEVWDTGVGIAPENMGKIFEGFFRVDTPYSRVTEGTGLGLPLSRNFVELHGGKFFAESRGLDRGTAVRFTLPIVSRKAV
jgi:two-component system CheB/CheR fusion protein